MGNDNKPSDDTTLIHLAAEQPSASSNPDRVPYTARALTALAEVNRLSSGPEKSVMIVLTAKGNRSGHSWLSTKSLAYLTGMSPRNLRRTIERLQCSTDVRPALVKTTGNIGGVSENGRGRTASRPHLFFEPDVLAFVRWFTAFDSHGTHTLPEPDEGGRRRVCKEGAGRYTTWAQCALQVCF